VPVIGQAGDVVVLELATAFHSRRRPHDDQR
jgi:hypothetical protein